MSFRKKMAIVVILVPNFMESKYLQNLQQYYKFSKWRDIANEDLLLTTHIMLAQAHTEETPLKSACEVYAARRERNGISKPSCLETSQN